MTALTHEPVSECPFKQGQRLGEESSYQDGSAVQYLNAHHTHISGLLSTKKLYKNIMKENNLQVIHFQTHTHTEECFIQLSCAIFFRRNQSPKGAWDTLQVLRCLLNQTSPPISINPSSPTKQCQIVPSYPHCSHWLPTNYLSSYWAGAEGSGAGH